MSASQSLPPLRDGTRLTHIGADNLRALQMPEPIELRRLLLLVGRNGVGKSTFARLFPLLRQSAGPRIREPLLWWEEDQVDFGSFAEAVRRGADEITLTFAFAKDDEPPWEVRTTLRGDAQTSRVVRVALVLGDHTFELIFHDDGTPASASGRVGGEAFTLDGADPALPTFRSEPWRLLGVPRLPEDPEPLLRLMEGIFHGRTEVDRRRSVVLGLDWADRRRMGRHLRNQGLGTKYTRELEVHFKRKGWPRALQVTSFCWHAIERLRTAEALIEELAVGTAYLGPFRAVPRRAYRPKSVAVEQLDPRGDNLVMFLAALSYAERRQLNEFLVQFLGFEVVVDTIGGQYLLRITFQGESFNLLDVGFGYSQVLPVAVQLWASGRVLSTDRRDRPLNVMVIEQPELHLHPHHQVLVARALAASAQEDSGPLQIVETHSDHLVTEIGLLVAKGQLDRDRVGVVCVEPVLDAEGRSVGATLRTTEFDEHGVLQNWPYGFLSP